MLVRVMLALAALLVTCPSVAQENDLEAEYAKKLEKKFAKSVDWRQEIAAAKKACREKNVPIIAYFTRSYSP